MRLIYLSVVFVLCASACNRPNSYPIEAVCVQPNLTATIAPPRRPIPSKPIIMIDPGHGGKDLGTVSLMKPEYQEKNLNLSTARLVETFLRQKGYRTVMTRADDTFISLDDRVAATTASKAKLFISIHYNSAPSAKAEGIEVFYYESDKEKERSQKSKALAQATLDKVIAETQASSRGVKHGNFAVIRNNTTPAILIEGGFMTNSQEMTRLKDPSYLKKLAWGIAEGIDTFVKEQHVK